MSPGNRREYLRTDITLSTRCRLLTREEMELVEQGNMSGILQKSSFSSPIDEIIEQLPSGSEDETLYRCLKMMDNKVNFIIEQMASPSDQPDKIMNAVIELSGSGIKFVSKDPFSKGVFLKMDLIMPDTIEFMVEFIASVVRVESKLPPAEKGVQEYCVAAQFAQIDERVRDAIIETIFKKQRKMIRLEKDQKVD
ncbi:MAG: hypothetical protein WAL98_14705 [Desulfatiglandaceae bacterium]|jgi:hypothetical protein